MRDQLQDDVAFLTSDACLPRTHDYSGVAVAKAARVASAASGGETLISSNTMELLDRYSYEIGTERVAELMGLNGTHRLFPLVAVGS